MPDIAVISEIQSAAAVAENLVRFLRNMPPEATLRQGGWTGQGRQASLLGHFFWEPPHREARRRQRGAARRGERAARGDREEERIEQRERAELDGHPRAKRQGQPGATTQRGKA